MVNITSKINVHMLISDKHIWHCILFAFQLKKNVAETEIICHALPEGAVTRTIKF
jgi:hypothetical protein